MVVVGEKLGMDLWSGQLVCYGLGREPFFSGAVDPFNSVDNFMIGYHIRGLPTGSVRVAYIDWRGKHTCYVYQVSSAWCTLIRITATLIYE
jgi:hypothetical protein